MIAACEDLVEAIEDARDAIVEQSSEDEYERVHRHAIVAQQCEWMIRKMNAVAVNVDMAEAQRNHAGAAGACGGIDRVL